MGTSSQMFGSATNSSAKDGIRKPPTEYPGVIDSAVRGGRSRSRITDFSRFFAVLSTNFFYFFRRISQKRREVAETNSAIRPSAGSPHAGVFNLLANPCLRRVGRSQQKQHGALIVWGSPQWHQAAGCALPTSLQSPCRDRLSQ